MKYVLIIFICLIKSLCAHSELQIINTLITNNHEVIGLGELASHVQKPIADVLNILCSSREHVTVIKFSSDKQCPTCALFAPVFARAARNIRSLFTGNKVYNLLYVSVDSSIHQNLLSDYGISVIPTVLSYHNGKLIAINTKPYSAFEKHISSLIDKIKDN